MLSYSPLQCGARTWAVPDAALRQLPDRGVLPFRLPGTSEYPFLVSQTIITDPIPSCILFSQIKQEGSIKLSGCLASKIKLFSFWPSMRRYRS